MSILKDSYLPACFTIFPENETYKVGQAQLENEIVAMNTAMMDFMRVKFSCFVGQTYLYFELTRPTFSGEKTAGC
jgi:hypothetical protein